MLEIRAFLDGEGRLKQLPSKRRKKIHALCYLAQKLEAGRTYSERETNRLLNCWHTFSDPATLRREMYDFGLLDRDPAGRCYSLADPMPTAQELMDRYI